ncbi:MAG: aminodeoxychorismate synthase component [Actinomycetota bacterium]|jgi:aminodeoxychorismate synthase component I
MPLYWEKLNGWTAITDTFITLYANQPGAFWLDRENHPTNRHSVIGVGIPTDELPSQQEQQADLPFTFRPGVVGVIHYSSTPGDISQTSLLRVDRALVYDHDTKVIYFVAQLESRKEFDDWHRAALLRIALTGGGMAAHELNYPAATAAELVADDSTQQYVKKIELAQAKIAAGDAYQLCLTTRLRGAFTGDPLSFFLRLRKQHPAPYSSFVRVGEKTIVSISPELFVSVHLGRVLSSPIKGTRKRSADASQDMELMNQLGQDPKERAENLMIVDLIRNDLSVVCEAASVSVDSLLAVRSFSTVHQLVSDVSGQLRQDKTSIDALRALFPGGSMTGAPKASAMHILQELESSPREVYSGAIGFIAANGDMELAMVIRTAVFEGQSVSIGVGGGITADSQPFSEHEEIQLKALALADVLGARVRW